MRVLRHLALPAALLACLAVWLGMHAIGGGSAEAARELSAFVIGVVILAALGVAADETSNTREELQDDRCE